MKLAGQGLLLALGGAAIYQNRLSTHVFIAARNNGWPQTLFMTVGRGGRDEGCCSYYVHSTDPGGLVGTMSSPAPLPPAPSKAYARTYVRTVLCSEKVACGHTGEAAMGTVAACLQALTYPRRRNWRTVALGHPLRAVRYRSTLSSTVHCAALQLAAEAGLEPVQREHPPSQQRPPQKGMS